MRQNGRVQKGVQYKCRGGCRNPEREEKGEYVFSGDFQVQKEPSQPQHYLSVLQLQGSLNVGEMLTCVSAKALGVF